MDLRLVLGMTLGLVAVGCSKENSVDVGQGGPDLGDGGQCRVPADCAGVDTECRTRTCSDGVCGFENLEEGTPCANGAGKCDGNGNCGGQCTPGQSQGCADAKSERICDDTGHWAAVPCAAPLTECDHGACRGGPAMVWISDGKGGTYGIDSTEVTRGQYQTWLSTEPSTIGQSDVCAWNTDFGPDEDCMTNPVCPVCQGTGCSNHPQVCVDWCDSYAFCQSMGKRLCGKIAGGAVSYGQYSNVTESQWHNACVSGSANWTYPYGNTYFSGTCNDYDDGAGTTVPVGSMTWCQSATTGYQGVLDLSGNVGEWEDSCDGTTGNMDYCISRGGSFFDPNGSVSSRCDHGVDRYRSIVYGNVGFRCCTP